VTFSLDSDTRATNIVWRCAGDAHVPLGITTVDGDTEQEMVVEYRRRSAERIEADALGSREAVGIGRQSSDGGRPTQRPRLSWESPA
jgi:hypothetical protein